MNMWLPTERKKSMPEDKKKVDVEEALDEALKTIQKQFGKGAVMRLGEQADLSVDVIPTGCISLDYALGIGGYPKGRVIEIFGPESSGKTTVALHAVAACQKNGGRVAYIDAEHAIDPTYAKNLGVVVDDLILSQPDSGEEAMQIADLLIRSNAIDLIVVDSVAALVPQAELEGEMSDAQVGMQARLMSKALRKITGNLGKSKCSIIFINQLREKMSMGFGPTGGETTSGGRALKFYASIRIDVRKIETLKKNSEPYGHRLQLKIVKNKVAPPFKVANVTLIYGEGISQFQNIIDLGVESGIISKSGSFYDYKGNRMQGIERLKEFFASNETSFHELEEEVREKLFEKNA